MDPFEKLRNVVMRQSLEGDFPDWLLEDVLSIADAPESYGAVMPLVEQLIDQIGEFDPFAGVGCFPAAVGIEQIQATVQRIKRH